MIHRQITIHEWFSRVTGDSMTALFRKLPRVPRAVRAGILQILLSYRHTVIPSLVCQFLTDTANRRNAMVYFRKPMVFSGNVMGFWQKVMVFWKKPKVFWKKAMVFFCPHLFVPLLS